MVQKINKPHICIDCNKTLSRNPNSIRCRSCASKINRKKELIKHPAKGKNYPKCKDCGKKLGDYKSIRCKSCVAKKRIFKQETKNKIGRANRGKRNGMFGVPSPQGKKILYKNYKLRNSWEVKYAKYLTKNHIKWQYEPKTFDLGNSTYTPDFYLPESDTYVEIKGYFRNKDRRKYLRFKRNYPKTKIILLQETELKNLGVL